ncbi:hypothetical protein HUJ04_002551 [Dendroctonus ponderosae]|nr:hypothetical protein HUJ04_002551 [Dendroctonus ponderosae]
MTTFSSIASVKMSTSSLEIENEKIDCQEENDLEAPMDYSVKHPLQNVWTLWYYENDRNQSWEKNQREISSFDTVEDFWSLYNHIKPASELKQGTDYSLFKKGIMPMWEDNANKKGIWTSDANNGTAILEIGRKLKERLNIPQRTIIGYEVHKDTMDKTGSSSKYSYTV